MATELTIGGYSFQCVSLSTAEFTDIAAVYVILCVASGGSWTVLDVGQTGELGSRIDNHDRRTCWQRNCASKNIWVCVRSMPNRDDRLRVEREIRNQYDPPCGER